MGFDVDTGLGDERGDPYIHVSDTRMVPEWETYIRIGERGQVPITGSSRGNKGLVVET